MLIKGKSILWIDKYLIYLLLFVSSFSEVINKALFRLNDYIADNVFSITVNPNTMTSIKQLNIASILLSVICVWILWGLNRSSNLQIAKRLYTSDFRVLHDFYNMIDNAGVIIHDIHIGDEEEIQHLYNNGLITSHDSPLIVIGDTLGIQKSFGITVNGAYLYEWYNGSSHKLLNSEKHYDHVNKAWKYTDRKLQNK